MNGIYSRIRTSCEEKNITIRDLEKMMGMKPNSLEDLRTEMPSVEELILLALYLEKPPYWIKSGQRLNKLSIAEECLILTFRELDDRGKRCVTHNASYQFEENHKTN